MTAACKAKGDANPPTSPTQTDVGDLRRNTGAMKTRAAILGGSRRGGSRHSLRRRFDEHRSFAGLSRSKPARHRLHTPMLPANGLPHHPRRGITAYRESRRGCDCKKAHKGAIDRSTSTGTVLVSTATHTFIFRGFTDILVCFIAAALYDVLPLD